jgi:hypothetical protein
MKTLIKSLPYITAVALIIILSIGGYFIKRMWNNYWYYDDATKDVVCEMVKPEYLKEGVCE